jgi:hypothetical protein
MKKMSSNLVFNIDIHDYQSKKDVIITIKKILQLLENEDFIYNFHGSYKKNRGLDVELKKGISFIITDCDCPSDELPF